jgi:hypothetical protein
MPDDDEWGSELRQLYEVDRERRQAQEKREAAPTSAIVAARLLQRCRAHELMRQLQKTFLNGRGNLRFYEQVGGYAQAVALMWSGPISAATNPQRIEDVDAAIIVGASEEGVFVNDAPLSEASPEALKQALLALARGFIAGEEP